MTVPVQSFFELSLATQIALGAGYLSYATAYAGWRKDHSMSDQIAITLVFSAIGMTIFQNTLSLGTTEAVSATLATTIFLSILWRIIGRKVWQKMLKTLKVHREDGINSGWSAMVQTTKGVSQATVYLKDGRTLHLADRSPYKGSDWQGLYLCTDGDIILVVDEETDPDGKSISREDIEDPNWGLRHTYVPREEIQRVELRMK